MRDIGLLRDQHTSSVGADELQSRLDFAVRIGRRMADSALWDGNVCTWEVQASVVVDGMRLHRNVRAGATLYDGTAGIGLFLAELAYASNDESIAHTAIGAMSHAVLARHRVRMGRGYFDGTLGIAWALSVASQRLAEPALLSTARGLVAEVEVPGSGESDFDVISGTAGSILALLGLDLHLRDGLAGAKARDLGEYLVNASCLGTAGRSWPTSMPSATRHLSGFAHGASGIAAALIQLYVRFREPEWLVAAEQALEWESQFYSKVHHSWATTRNETIMSFEDTDSLSALGDRALNGPPIEATPPAYSHSWCWGSAGMIPVRLELAALSGNVRLTVEAQRAASALAEGLSVRQGYCLCHGGGGSADALLHATRLDPGAGHLATIDKWVNEVGALYSSEHSKLISGIPGGSYHPGLMTGEAGLGHFLLRTRDQSVVSVLCPTQLEGRTRPIEGSWREAADRAHVATHFQGSIDSLDALGVPLSWPRITARPPEQSAPAAAYAQIIKILTEADSSIRDYIADATLLDRRAYVRNEEFSSRLPEVLAQFQRLALRDEWAYHHLIVSPQVEIVRPKWDWGSWARSPVATVPPPDAIGPTLLYQSDGQTRRRAMDAFDMAVFELFDTPLRHADLLEDLSERYAESEVMQVRKAVGRFVGSLYDLAVLVCARCASTDEEVIGVAADE